MMNKRAKLIRDLVCDCTIAALLGTMMVAVGVILTTITSSCATQPATSADLQALDSNALVKASSATSSVHDDGVVVSTREPLSIGNIAPLGTIANGLQETQEGGYFSPMFVNHYFDGQLHNEMNFAACRGTQASPLQLNRADSMLVITTQGCGSSGLQGNAAEMRITNANVNDTAQMPANSSNVATQWQLFLGRPDDPNPPERVRVDWMGHLAFTSQGIHFGPGPCAQGHNPGACTVVTNCGINPSDPLLSSNSSASGDNSGSLIIGSMDAGCTIAFSGTFQVNQHSSAAVCLVQVQHSNQVVNFDYNDTGIQVNDPVGALAGMRISWHCFGASGGTQQ